MTFLAYLIPILLLIVSNTVMVFAWYGHLKFPQMTLWLAILVSWGIAFIEYCFAVTANRVGYQVYTLSELKTIQLIAALAAFVFVASYFFGERITAQHILGFTLMATGAGLIFGVK